MKFYKSLFILCIIFYVNNTYGQVNLGLKLGMSSFNMNEHPLLIKDQLTDKYIVDYKGANYGYHFGVFVEAKYSALSIQPAVILNSTKINYTFEDLGANSVVKSFKTYTNLDVPILLGVNIKRLRIQAGPVAHLILRSSDDIFENTEYEEMFKKATYGYQAGVSIEILWNMKIDINYEGNIERFGEQFIYKGNEYQFEDRPHRWVASFVMNFF